MEKRFAVLIALILLIAVPQKALAQIQFESTPTPAATDNAGATTLSIDDENVYAGMDKAYKNGYVPLVKDGYATVIVPLIADGAIKGSAIIATPGLGEPSSSPFVFKNYQKTVYMAPNSVNDGSATVVSYLIRFDLQLEDDRSNGTYPVTVNVQAQGTDGSGLAQSFTAYVSIVDGVDANGTQPKVIVSRSGISPSKVAAGDAFSVRVTLKNISSTKSVKNLVVTASCESQNITLKNASDTLVVDSLGAGKTTTITLSYKSDIDTPEQQYKINLSMVYEDAQSASLSTSGTVTFSVSQPLRVEMDKPRIAAQVNAGDTMPLSFQVMNMGRSKVYNVRVELSCAGLFPTGVAFIGNMEAGTASTGNMDVFIGTRDMTESFEGEEKYGQTNGIITLLYEDAKGQEYKRTTEFYTTIKKPVISQPADTEAEKPKMASQWWITIVICVTLVTGLAVLLVVRRRRRMSDR